VWLALGIAAAAVAFLVAMRTVLQPFVWAAVVSFTLNPVVNQLQRRLRLTRGWSVTAVMLVLLGLAAWTPTSPPTCPMPGHSAFWGCRCR
jgi:predicted PurR-regulated permease PerM